MSDTISEEPSPYAPELFEQLRGKRKEVADAAEVPPYVVFHDKALQEMATHFPESVEAFAQMHGVGPAKVEKYADLFLPIIRAYCQASKE